MYPDLGVERGRKRRAGELEVVSGDHDLVERCQRGDQPRGRGGFVHDLGLPSEEGRGGVQRICAIGPPPTTTSFATGTRIVMTRSSLIVVLLSVAVSVTPTSSRASHRSAVEVQRSERRVGARAASPTARTAGRPRERRDTGRRRHADKPSDECVDIGDGHLDEPVAGKVGELTVERAAQHRAYPPAAWSDGDSLG